MTNSTSSVLHSLDTVRTIRQNANLRDEPFLVVSADDVVVLSGWMFDTAATAVPRVFARISGGVIPASRARRDDIAAAYGERMGHAGFSLAVAVEPFGAPVLDVELVYTTANGGLLPFDRRRIVVVPAGSVERSDAVVIEQMHDLANQRSERGEAAFSLGIPLAVEGWGFALDAAGARLSAAAIIASGRIYQAVYRIPRDDIRGAGFPADTGYFGRIPSLRLGEGTHELRARLFSEAGTSVESRSSLHVRLVRGRG